MNNFVRIRSLSIPANVWYTVMVVDELNSIQIINCPYKGKSYCSKSLQIIQDIYKIPKYTCKVTTAKIGLNMTQFTTIHN